MVKNVINFFIAVELFFQFLRLDVGLLQLLQLEPHNTSINFIKFFIG